MIRPILLVIGLTPTTLLLGAFLLRLFVHSGGIGLWLAFALAPGAYIGSLFARGLGDSWFFPVSIVTQTLYCAGIVTLGFALVRPRKQPH